MIVQNKILQFEFTAGTKGIFAALLICLLVACTSVPLAEIANAGLVVVSSHEAIRERQCSFLQKYRVTTTTDFTTSLDIFRGRAYSFGGNAVVITYHNERDAAKGSPLYNKFFANARKSLGFEEKEIVSIIEGDVFMCGNTKQAKDSPA